MRTHYELNDSDYKTLNLYFTPEKVAEIFQEHSKHPRSIRRILKRLGVPTHSQMVKEYISLHSPTIIGVSETERNQILLNSIQEQGEWELKIIWSKIHRIENGA